MRKHTVLAPSWNSPVLLAIFASLGALLPCSTAWAQSPGGASSATGFVAIASALCMSAGAFGAALGQSRTAAAALEGIARNPSAAGKVQTPMIIALAMTESLALFALVIAFFLQGKV